MCVCSFTWAAIGIPLLSGVLFDNIYLNTLGVRGFSSPTSPPFSMHDDAILGRPRENYSSEIMNLLHQTYPSYLFKRGPATF